MNVAVKVAVVAAVALIPVFADTVPIAGSTAGTFSNVSGGSLNAGKDVWTYDSGASGSSTLSFIGNTIGNFNNCSGGSAVSFACFTPVTVNLGALTDVNNRLDNTNQTFSGTLNIAMNFTTPSGGLATFTGGVGIDEVCGTGNNFDCVTSLNNFDGPLITFSAAGDLYTVTLLGFYFGDPFSTQSVNEFDTKNPLTGTSNSSSAHLYATITAVPEPTSLLLLGTLCGPMLFAWRKRSRQQAGR